MVGKRIAALSVALGVLGALVACTPVPNPPPPPTISGTPAVGSTLTASPGAWQNNPTSYGYAWSQCSDSAGVSCTAISGATSKTYTPVAGDVGRFVKVTVSGTNAFGTGAETKDSGAVGPIATGHNPSAGCYSNDTGPYFGYYASIAYSGTPGVVGNISWYPEAANCAGTPIDQPTRTVVLGSEPALPNQVAPTDVNNQCIALGYPLGAGSQTPAQQGWIGLGDYLWFCEVQL